MNLSEGMSYGICVGDDPKYVNKIIASIEQNHDGLKNYEIILANNDIGWITHKKNWIAKQAKYDTLCLIHDYVYFPRFWFKNVWDWIRNVDIDVLMTQVVTWEGKRGPDWILDPNWMNIFIEQIPSLYDILYQANPSENHPKYVCGLSYGNTKMTPFQYISGAYILTKTQYMLDHPFDEMIEPGEAEDVQWFEQWHPRIDMNPFTWVTFLKPHKWAITEIPEEAMNKIMELYQIK